MAERERGSGTTWKAVRTLEYKKKQRHKGPEVEQKGFGAILDEAQNAVNEKWSSSGNLVPSYLKRLSEIQIQDEAYIHQQLVKEEAKPRRGLQQLLSKSKGRGLRLARSICSRKVRFNDEGHSKSSATEQLVHVYKVGTPAIRQLGSFRGSGKASKQPGVTFADSSPSSPDTAAASAAAVAGDQHQISSSGQGSSTQSSSSGAAAGAQPLGNAAIGLISGDRAGWHGQTQAISQAQQPGYSGDGGIMARFLGPAAHAWGSSCGQYEEPSRTQLADKQLELLRGNASQPGGASPGAAAGQQPDSPQGFRPLAISEELFARWSSAAGGSGPNVTASTAGTGSSKAGSGGSRPPSRPRGGAEGAGTNTSGSQHGTSRRVSAGALSTTALGSGQQVLGGASGSPGGARRGSRPSAEYNALGAAASSGTSSKQRRSAEYASTAGGSTLHQASPRVRSSEQYSSSPGALAATAAQKNPKASSCRADLAPTYRSSPTPKTSSPARSGLVGPGPATSTMTSNGSSGRSNSNLRASRMVSADSAVTAASAGNPLLRVSGVDRPRTQSADLAGSNPLARRSGGALPPSVSGAQAQVGSSRASSGSSTGSSGGSERSSTAGARKSSDKLPGIGRVAADKQQGASGGRRA